MKTAQALIALTLAFGVSASPLPAASTTTTTTATATPTPASYGNYGNYGKNPDPDFQSLGFKSAPVIFSERPKATVSVARNPRLSVPSAVAASRDP